MSLQSFFGYISAVLSILMIIPYVRDILKKKTRPERASWFIWTVLGFIAFASQLAKGATHSLWLTAGQTLAVLVVFILSIKFGTGGLVSRDIKALIAAGFGLFMWYITSEPLFALVMVIFVDGTGTLLTAIKAYQEPETETLITWLISGTSGIFGVLAVGNFDPVLVAYPVYIVAANFIIASLLLLGRKRIRQTANKLL
ncbi:MAG: hypothetical protein PHC70_00370 [Patescibacteria group bacterium]|nr:hypothetical protein [Patescibacteria group bacterium]